MDSKLQDRRALLQSLGAASLLPAFTPALAGQQPEHGSVAQETLSPSPDAEVPPKYSIRFAVCGMSHDHIYAMVGAIERGGGKLVAVFGEEPDKIAAFK